MRKIGESLLRGTEEALQYAKGHHKGASEADRNNWRIIGNGIGVHWPNIDEDIAVSTLL